jgi:hypothetical protein
MAVVDCYGKQTPKGPNYNVTDKFNYTKGPEWKIGTDPRNTLDTKAKYEHYFRKDIDVSTISFSSISTRQIKFVDSIMETLASVETQGYFENHVVPSPREKVQNDPRTLICPQSQARNT